MSDKSDDHSQEKPEEFNEDKFTWHEGDIKFIENPNEIERTITAFMDDISLHFNGPMTFLEGDHSLFRSRFTESSGIYLWVIKDNNDINHIHYVGETFQFAKRQREHIIQILGMNYRIIEATSAREGREVILWNGLWRDKSNQAVGLALDAYERLSHEIMDYIKIIDVYFAETNVPVDIRKHIEGSIGWNVRKNHSKSKVFYPDDNHVGTRKQKVGISLFITSDEEILGLDHELII